MALKYTIKLTHYAFDNTYSNARLFDTKTARDTYFDNLAGYTYSDENNTPIKVNFNARDILRTDIILKVEPNAPLFSLLNYNYAIIKSDSEVLYFYAKISVQESGGLIRVALENDIFQNYWYDMEFDDCMINRAHLNRFEEDSNDTTKVNFKCDKNSDLFEREDIKDVAKRLVSRQRLMLHQDLTNNSKLNTWLYNNVLAWCYISITKGSYDIEGNNNYNADYTQVKTQTDVAPSMTYANSLLCFPIMKGLSTLHIATPNAEDYVINQSAFNSFIGRQVDGYANVYSIKLSIKPPFDLKQYVEGTNYDVSDPDDALQTCTIYSTNNIVNGYANIGNNLKILKLNSITGLFNVIYDDPTPIEATLVNNAILPTLKFAKTDIIGVDKNILFNPKLNNMDYKELRITFAGSSESYDLQKLNDSEPTFEYYEMLTSDVTKALLQYKPKNNNGVFSTAYGESYNGLMFTNDLSLPFATTQYQEFFANNKNAYLSFQNQQQLSNVQYYARSAGNIASILTGNLSAGKQLAVDTITHAAQLNFERAQFELTLDNMRSAPEKQQNVNGNAILINAIAPLGIYVEVYEALNNELKIANDIAYDNGYIFNQYGNIKDYVNTRKYFNYIKAIPTNIKADISNDAKMIMRQILANGIKLWHTDSINLKKENYELWLEE